MAGVRHQAGQSRGMVGSHVLLRKVSVTFTYCNLSVRAKDRCVLESDSCRVGLGWCFVNTQPVVSTLTEHSSRFRRRVSCLAASDVIGVWDLDLG